MYVCSVLAHSRNAEFTQQLDSSAQIWEFLLQTDQFAESTAMVREQVRFSILGITFRCSGYRIMSSFPGLDGGVPVHLRPDHGGVQPGAQGFAGGSLCYDHGCLRPSRWAQLHPLVQVLKLS
jgi:hypothetical protein